MRKFVIIALSVLLVLSLTALAYAQDVKLGGRILIRGWYIDNIGLNAALENVPIKTQSQARYSTNAFITVDAKVADNVKGFMELESCDNRVGSSGLYTWGQSYDQKPVADLFFRQLWIQYTGSGLLGVPAGIKVGHQLLALGEKQFLRHERFGDDAILVFVEPTKEVFLAALTAKLVEGTAGVHSDDIDAYSILTTYKLDKDNTLGINYTLIHSDALTAPAVIEAVNFSNLGLHANGKLAVGITYAAELDVQFGEVDLIGADDIKFRGVGLFAKAGYAIPDTPLTIRGSFAAGSGDSDAGDNKNKEFQTTVGNDNQSLYARFPNYTLIYERAIRSAAAPYTAATAGQQLTLGNTRSTGIANTTYYNLGLDLAPTKDTSISLDGFIIRATKAWQTDQSKNIGTEVDAKFSYKIAKNLTYFVEGGLFSPGKYYTTGAAPVNDALGKETVTMLVHGLNLTF